MKTDSSVICVPCMLEHVLKIADLEDILRLLVKFCVQLISYPLDQNQLSA